MQELNLDMSQLLAVIVICTALLALLMRKSQVIEIEVRGSQPSVDSHKLTNANYGAVVQGRTYYGG